MNQQTQQQRNQQREINQLQRQHAAMQAMQQRQELALELGDKSKQGHRVWIIPEFNPDTTEEDYIIESVRGALPEYHCQMAIDTTDPMTKKRIHRLLEGGELEDGK